VAWATKALDEVRREVWNDARHRGEHAHARQLKRTRYAVWRNQENLTERQQRKLAWLEQVNRPLFRAYLLKENLRLVFQLPFDLAVELLGGVAALGLGLAHRRLRAPRRHHCQPDRRDPDHARTPPLERTGGGGQHSHRLPFLEAADCTCDAQLRRLQAGSARSV